MREKKMENLHTESPPPFPIRCCLIVCCALERHSKNQQKWKRGNLETNGEQGFVDGLTYLHQISGGLGPSFLFFYMSFFLSVFEALAQINSV